MRVATAREMSAVDRETIEGGTPGLELMERAGREMTWELLRQYPHLEPPAQIAVCCGRGNNGGDGLVMARLFEALGFQVAVMLLAPADELSADARANLDRLPPGVEVAVVAPGDWAARWTDLCEESDLALDAVFGTGVRPPVGEDHARLFRAFNAAPTPVVAVDVPSGVAGNDGAVDPVAVRAETTLTVGLPKLGLLLPPGRDFVGDLAIVDIGFADEVCARHTADRHYLLPADYAALLPSRPSDTHKYGAGTVLVLAGSQRYGGAALLAGMGALRSGAGLVTLALPERHAAAALAALPEAPQIALPTGPGGGLAPLDAAARRELCVRQNALAVGPGLGDAPDTDRFLVDFLGETELPLVVDADGLSAFARTGVVPRFASDRVVLTPHAGELARLAGLDAAPTPAERMDLAPDLAARWGAVVVAKGSPTMIGLPDGGLVINPTGDDALAHGGTGDVLTGLIGGLLGQGCDAEAAAVLGCWLHGRAGELAAAGGRRRSLLAREVADHLPDAFAELEILAQGLETVGEDA